MHNSKFWENLCWVRFECWRPEYGAENVGGQTDWISLQVSMSYHLLSLFWKSNINVNYGFISLKCPGQPLPPMTEYLWMWNLLCIFFHWAISCFDVLAKCSHDDCFGLCWIWQCWLDEPIKNYKYVLNTSVFECFVWS